MWLLTIYYFLAILGLIVQGQNVKFLVVTESAQPELNAKFTQGLKTIQDSNPGTVLDIDNVNFTRKFADDAYTELCNKLQSGTYTAIIDMAWGGWIKGRKIGAQMGIPYIRVEAANHPFVRAADDYLKYRKSVDAALIFPKKSGLDQSLYYIIGNSPLRIIGAQMTDTDGLDRLKRMRPRPSNYIVWGSQEELQDIYDKAKAKDMIKRDSKWTLVFNDFAQVDFPQASLKDLTTLMTLTPESCCAVLDSSKQSNCECTDLVMPEKVVEVAASLLGQAALKMASEGKSIRQSWNCNAAGTSNQTRQDYEAALESTSKTSRYLMQRDKHSIPHLTPNLIMNIRLQNKSTTINVGSWNPTEGIESAPGYALAKVKRFFRVGVVLGQPWAWIEGAINPTDAKYLNSSMPNKGLTGYCIDLLIKLSVEMDFDYEIIPSTKNQYGHKLPNGSWTGLVGDLISGEIDISVATLTMTTEREEVIDFVAPYFDQSGISILLRKKAPEQSMFKFLKVLKKEVWYGLMAAVAVVSILLWALDRFSPYSYHNNKDAYPEGARDFTLGESIWFALTSLTPQGGGECPKALSGRVLVAAYWLFIVLMLATFTANLAAFLTVERMQTTVQSLDELARQSRINYTTVSDSPYLEYFKNMAGAEEELYRKWKEITLNSSSDQSKYRVWDYPVREQYTHILKVINQSGTVDTPEEGFKNVEESTTGQFAFIYDAAEIKYQFYKNCNFIEVGEPFAEQPLAVAVQQGSHLQKEISKAILALQKERYFEELTSTYWNTTTRTNCPVLDDSKGITLRSLGGIFLATLAGLILSMITLAYEVWQQKKQEKSQVSNEDRGQESNSSISKIVNVGSKQIQLDAGKKAELQSGLPPVGGYF